jgi:hypothetical protein
MNSIVLTNLIISLRKTNDKKNKKHVNSFVIKNYKDLVHSSSKDGLLHCANLSKIINLLKAFYLLTLLIKIEIVNG